MLRADSMFFFGLFFNEAFGDSSLQKSASLTARARRRCECVGGRLRVRRVQTSVGTRLGVHLLSRTFACFFNCTRHRGGCFSSVFVFWCPESSVRGVTCSEGAATRSAPDGAWGVRLRLYFFCKEKEATASDPGIAEGSCLRPLRPGLLPEKQRLPHQRFLPSAATPGLADCAFQEDLRRVSRGFFALWDLRRFALRVFPAERTAHPPGFFSASG